MMKRIALAARIEAERRRSRRVTDRSVPIRRGRCDNRPK
jgi:hypothetical protein